MNFGPMLNQDKAGMVPSKRRAVLIVVIMLFTLGVVTARLVELTVVHGAENRSRADENRIAILQVPANRGVILDRNGVVLTRNVPMQREMYVEGIGKIPVEGAGRSYPYGQTFAHVVGYVSESDGKNPIGKTGLEKQYQDLLGGKDGGLLIEVDANGKIVGAEGEEPPIPGRNLNTTLDLSLQQTMGKALGNRRGVAVALDPVDGSVLGLVSSPAFDPNVFGDHPSENFQSTIHDLLSDTTNLPLFNRVISGVYPPGSIFKLVTATAGLESGKVTDETTVSDTGELKVGTFRYGNWYFDQYGRTEGVLGIVRAISRSNDIFFYKVGEWVGPGLLSDWAKKFGLGKATGVDIPGEAEGLIPDPIWKERQIGERWFLGNTYHMAIGQGDVRVTPLQAAVMTSAAATGTKCMPHIAASPVVTPVCGETNVSDKNRQLILDGMVGACSSGGTAFPFFPWNESGDPAMVACKTGTAQHGGENKKPHAWIAVAGPVRKAEGQGLRGVEGKYELDLNSDKRIVLAVMLEEAGEGSVEAGPVAKEILTEWFKIK